MTKIKLFLTIVALALVSGVFWASNKQPQPLGAQKDRLDVLLAKLNSDQPLEWNEAQYLIKELDAEIQRKGGVQITRVKSGKHDPELLKQVGRKVRPQ